jgi:hypothetical protein
MKKVHIFICDGKEDNIEFQKTVDWVDEDPKNRSAEIRPSCISKEASK